MSPAKSRGNPKPPKKNEPSTGTKKSSVPFHRRVPYVQQNDRLELLADFVSQYAPMPPEFVGEDSPIKSDDPVASINDEDVTSARNLALIEAYRAIRRIAADS